MIEESPSQSGKKADTPNIQKIAKENFQEQDIEKDEKVYAKIFDPSLFKGKKKEDLQFFECDYILRCVSGLFYDKQIRLKQIGSTITIGSNEEKCNIFLDDKSVSPMHCRITDLENTFYYVLEDLSSETGTWMKVLGIDNHYEIKGTTYFKLFQHGFKLIIFNIQDKISSKQVNEVIHCQFIMTEGPKKGTLINIKKDSFLTFGKKECQLNLDINTLVNVTFKILSFDGKVYILEETKEPYEGGLFFRINNRKLLKAGDCIKIGESAFTLIPYNYSFFCEMGDRKYQEDKFCIIDDLRICDEIILPYFAVYDGHGGATCSEFLKKYLHDEFHTYFKYKNISQSPNFLNDLVTAIQEIIVFVDINYYESEQDYSAHHGSTCVFVFFIGTYVLCCNLGDSLSILVKNNGKRIYLSKDFNPSREKEKQRIEYKKGYISNDDRLLGTIAVSRAFGDWKYKDKKKQNLLKKAGEFDEYLISNRPEFRIIELNPKEDSYIILGSDGIFQNANHKDVIKRISKYYNEQKYENGLKNIPEAVDNFRLDLINTLESDVSFRGKADNMTLIFINLFNESLDKLNN